MSKKTEWLLIFKSTNDLIATYDDLQEALYNKLLFEDSAIIVNKSHYKEYLEMVASGKIK